MTEQHQPAPAPQAPFAAMLRGALVPTLVASVLVVLALWVFRGTDAALAALLAVAVTVGFFAAGLYVMKRVTNDNPLSLLAGALAVYLGQVIFLGVIILGLSGASWLDGMAFGLAALAVTIVWQVFQIVAFVRLRKSVYDVPPASGDASAAGE
jgi:ATP synthase protein I